MTARKIAALAAWLLTFGLGACTGPGSQPQVATSPPEIPSLQEADTTLVVALAQTPVSLDPADHRSRTSETVIRSMFDGLVARDTGNQVRLELAERMTWTDERTLEVRLRQGVRFHDGVEMTADDAVFTFNRIIQENAIEYPEPHSSPRRSLIAPLESIEKVDRYGLVLRFDSPWPPAMQMLVHQQIVPKHYLEAVGTEGFVKHPIGTGPFKFVSASLDLEEVVVERFADYWRGSPEPPSAGAACVRRVEFRAIPDPWTRAAALAVGQVDIIQGVAFDLVQTLESDPGVQVKTAPGTQPKWMELNVNRPPFDDVRVRQALNYGVDKQRLIDEVYAGRAVALPGPLSPFNNFVNLNLEPYAYDSAKALELLGQAGWADTNGDSILDREGRPLAFAIDTLQEWLPLARAVSEQLLELGIEAEVRIWEFNLIQPRLLAGERLAYLDDWGDSAFDPVGHFEAKWHAYVEGQPYGQGNYSGYNNARVNELIEMGERTADKDERQKIYDEAQRIIYEEVPAVFLVVPEEVEAASVRVQNWEPASDSRIHLYEVCVSP
jgi:peptide/nickel transport system substrate-binding protein